MSNKAKIREEVRKLVPIDDVMFRKLAEDKLFCQEILRVIMQDPQLEVLNNTPQYDVTNLQGRSVILDAHCRLRDGRELDIDYPDFYIIPINTADVNNNDIRFQIYRDNLFNTHAISAL